MIASKSFVFRFADVTVREREFAVIKTGHVQQVEPKAFRVLLILIQNPNKLVTKEELLNSVWADAAVTENSLTRNIALLRRMLGDDPREPRFIETVTGVGYRWLCPVELVEDSMAVSLLQEPAEALIAVAVPAPSAVVVPQAPSKRRQIWTAAALGAALILPAGGYWYLTRPLPPPTVSAYRQITSDGGEKELWATDGPRIYFSRNHSVRDVIFEVSASGGDGTKIPIRAPGPVDLFDLSPDGSKFVASILGDSLWTLRASDGVAVLPLPRGNWPSISPDGRTVAYTTHEGGIWLVGSDGAGAHRIVSLQGNPASLAWSPDGRRIRFTLGDHIWELRSDGSNLHQLLTGWQDSKSQCCGRWTADGSFFLFLTQIKGAISQEIWALDERHSLLRRPSAVPIRLTSGPTNWTTLVPAKDPNTIYATGETQRGELARLDMSTQQFRPFFCGISVEGTKFSPDGRSVIYVSWPEQFLFRANADGSDPVQLTDSRFSVSIPVWSPDGKQIVFTDTRSDPFAIYVVSSFGGVPKRVIPEDRETEGDPTWSPDGKKIVFGGPTYGAPGFGDTGVRVVDLATNTVSELPGSKGMWSPRWSPDGRYIVALNHDNHLQLFDTRTQTWLPPLQDVFSGYPTWSADGQWLYYLIVKTSDDWSICRLRVPDGKPEEVIHLTEQYTAGWWGWFGLDSANAPIVMRDMGRHEIYALTLSQK